MTMKVSELAKELEMTSKELVEKANAMEIEAKTASSALSDIDAKTLKNTIIAKRKKGSETKIVRVAAKKPDATNEKESKVKVKTAKVKPAGETVKVVKPAPVTKAAKSEKKAYKQTANKPVVKNAGRPPIGKAKPKKAVLEDAAKEVEAAKRNAAAKVIEDKAKAEAQEKRPIRKNGPIRRQEIRIIKSASEQRAEKEAKEAKAAKEAAEKAAKAKKEAKLAPKRNSDRRPNDRKPTGDRNDRKPTGDRNDRKPTVEKVVSDKAGTAAKKHIDKDKERSKFNKTDKKQPKRPVRSLEKRAKKKHIKQKPVLEPEVEVEALPVGTKVVNVPITIAGFCEQVGVSIPSIIMTLLKLGVVANQNQNIDGVTVEMIAEEIGIHVVIGQVEEETEEKGLESFEDREGDLESRPPIITVMGHVDHGKTSLLDAIRKTDVTAQESGGITQHIGASEVEINGQKIVFLDTPGHEAFTAMRARGADITDIAVLVVAADDSVKPQTIESISHAKAAGVPIIVAINKMDKPGANPEAVKKDLTEHGIVVEEWGGDAIAVPVSAKTGEGIVNLLEMILLQSEVLELKANPDRLAMGTVLEARLDKGKGSVASLLVTNGTLKAGQSVVAGTCSGRIRLMTNHKGETIRKAGPATAVEILGLTDVPAAGDTFNAVSEDRVAKEIAEKRKSKQREEVMARNSSSTLEELFSHIEEGKVKELNLIIKGDVRGSVGAVTGSLEKLSNKNVKVKIVHSGVGAINESDVTLAGTSGAILIGFNVRPSSAVSSMADREGVEIRTYRVIYNIIDDIENAMKGMLDPEFKEEVLGEVEIRETFKVPGIGVIGGSYVTNGKIIRNCSIRLVRDGIVIHEGTISSLKRFKDDAKEVAQGFECGIGIENFNDVKEGDIIECFHMVEIERK